MISIETYRLLANTTSHIHGVSSIGKSGGEKLPEQKESDIDLFVFCGQIPTAEARRAAYEKLGKAVSDLRISETSDRFWGVCDFLIVENTELSLLFFTVSDMNAEVASVLDGSRLDREGEYFYPTGRCASFLGMHILYDPEGYIAAMKEKLSQYPLPLAEKLFRHHVEKIDDEEDFQRAVSRGDVLFYHATLESAIDHFLQALFALNRCYFPSRKRTLQSIDGFAIKPRDCSPRLLQAVRFGAEPQTLGRSYDIWSALCRELSALCPGA